MGDFHERKILTVIALAGFGFALLQAGTSPVQAMMISAVTTIGVILGDLYYCTNRKVTEHIRRLGFYGAIGTISFLVLLVPFIMFLIGGIILLSVAYRIFQSEVITENELLEQSSGFIAALMFFLVYSVPELFIIPIVIIYGKFLTEQWPDKVKI